MGGREEIRTGACMGGSSVDEGVENNWGEDGNVRVDSAVNVEWKEEVER